MTEKINTSLLYPELSFHATRSSGAGGQHVNKVNTRVELRFDIVNSAVLTVDQKSILLEKLSNRITKDGELIVVSEKTRSQHRNREDCLEKFYSLLLNAFVVEKPRLTTRPSFNSFMRRQKTKKLHSLKKQNRKKPDL
jgi:ribosome-associated protein